MLNHQDIWAALDNLALKFSMSTSAMARQAGLDPTTFNKSKRQSADGKPRWPSTESLAKVLNVLGVDFQDFAVLTAEITAKKFGQSMGVTIPLIDLSQAGGEGFFSLAGMPMGDGWDAVRVPGVNDEHIFALQISGDSMAPVLRHGDRVIVAPGETIRRGDRIVVKMRNGEILIKELQNINAKVADLGALSPDYPNRVVALKDVMWISRIVWVSQ